MKNIIFIVLSFMLGGCAKHNTSLKKPTQAELVAEHGIPGADEFFEDANGTVDANDTSTTIPSVSLFNDTKPPVIHLAGGNVGAIYRLHSNWDLGGYAIDDKDGFVPL